MSKHITYLSLGAGVQSSALFVASVKGLWGVPKADFAVFADTQDEPQWVYDQLERLCIWDTEGVIPIYVTTAGKLSDDAINRDKFVSIPVYTMSEDFKQGMLRRQCTREYKIEPIIQFVRKYLGYEKRKHVKHTADCLIGISIDEAIRAKPNRVKWITNKHPLIDSGKSRKDCIELLEKEGLPNMRKSSCVYCPYHSDRFWMEMRDGEPEEFAKAVEFDEAIRNKSMKKDQPIFIHRSCTPLATAVFDPEKNHDLFGEECEGMCGV